MSTYDYRLACSKASTSDTLFFSLLSLNGFEWLAYLLL
jgi:hypothetical protein